MCGFRGNCGILGNDELESILHLGRGGLFGLDLWFTRLHPQYCTDSSGRYHLREVGHLPRNKPWICGGQFLALSSPGSLRTSARNTVEVERSEDCHVTSNVSAINLCGVKLTNEKCKLVY